MIKITNRGDFKKANSSLEKCLEVFDAGYLDKWGKRGVELLAEATPKRTGLTAASWRYEITRVNGFVSLYWYNTNVVHTRRGPVPVATLIETGHMTGRGTYVKGRDYIGPVMDQLFNEMAAEGWKGLVND